MGRAAIAMQWSRRIAHLTGYRVPPDRRRGFLDLPRFPCGSDAHPLLLSRPIRDADRAGEAGWQRPDVLDMFRRLVCLESTPLVVT